MNLIRRVLNRLKMRDAKKLWQDKSNPCQYSDIIYKGFRKEFNAPCNRVLEFGCNWGGNLKYFMDRIPDLETVGIDINPVVLDLEKKYPNYKGIVGDEKSLKQFKEKEFDLAFTVSVLDHIPDDSVVEEIIKDLVRISRHVLLLEPYIEGVHRNVSNKYRDSIKKGLERGYKKFAPHSYIWNYDKMLNRTSTSWKKKAMPLHAHSLGPFYYLYSIDTA
jgi:hypothetical protein